MKNDYDVTLTTLTCVGKTRHVGAYRLRYITFEKENLKVISARTAALKALMLLSKSLDFEFHDVTTSQLLLLLMNSAIELTRITAFREYLA